jgi:hypothetical protein
MKVRRETLIALRARRTAYRIASDFLNPHLDLPKPDPLVPPPRIDLGYQPSAEPSDLEWCGRLMFAGVFVAFSLLVLWFAAHAR